MIKQTSGNIAVLEQHIKLPKLSPVRFAKSPAVERRIFKAIFRRSLNGKYSVSVISEVEVVQLTKLNSSTGVDLGLSDFAILSDDGTKYKAF